MKHIWHARQAAIKRRICTNLCKRASLPSRAGLRSFLEYSPGGRQCQRRGWSRHMRVTWDHRTGHMAYSNLPVHKSRPPLPSCCWSSATRRSTSATRWAPHLPAAEATSAVDLMAPTLPTPLLEPGGPLPAPTIVCLRRKQPTARRTPCWILSARAVRTSRALSIHHMPGRRGLSLDSGHFLDLRDAKKCRRIAVDVGVIL